MGAAQKMFDIAYHRRSVMDGMGMVTSNDLFCNLHIMYTKSVFATVEGGD